MTTWRICQPNPPSWVVIRDEDLAGWRASARPHTFTSKRDAVLFIRGFSLDTVIQFFEGEDSRQCSVYPGEKEPKGGFLDETPPK